VPQSEAIAFAGTGIGGLSEKRVAMAHIRDCFTYMKNAVMSEALRGGRAEEAGHIAADLGPHQSAPVEGQLNPCPASAACKKMSACEPVHTQEQEGR